MPYLSGTNFDPRFDRTANVQSSGGRSGKPTAQMDDEDDVWSKQTYINHVYGGPISNRPEVQQVIAKQYDYNKMRVLSKKDPLEIADVRWDPTAYDDAMNEWMNARYQMTGKLPSGEERLDYFRDEAANKWRGTFESSVKPTESTLIKEMTQTPSTYEQAKAMGMQTAPTPASDMQTTKDQDSNGQAQTSAFALASPQQIVTDLNHRIAFTQQHYDGDPVKTYWANRDIIDAQYDNDKRNAAGQGALQNSGGPSQLASDVSPGQPTAYEQAKAPGTQTTQVKPSAVTTAKDQDSGSVRSAWVNALDQFLPESIFPEAPLPAQTDIPAWMPKWLLQAADTAKVLNRALPSNLVTNYLLGTLPTATKSAYLNSVAAGANALAGKPIEYTPDMTMADYTAQEARKLNVMDPLAEANRMSPWLGIPASILAEWLSDPTTFVGLGELQAIGRGSKAAKMWTLAYEDALKAGRLTPKTEAAAIERFRTDARAGALQNEKAMAVQLADDTAQGYTQNGRRTADDVLQGDINALQTNVEGLEVTASSKIYTPVEYKGTVKVNGEVKDVSRRVYQRNDIDIYYFNETTGLTNLERMQAGKPPIGSDGNPIELHHVLQKEAGPMAELRELTHQTYFSQLHGLVENGASFRNDPLLNKQYNNFRYNYWKWRASQITGG